MKEEIFYLKNILFRHNHFRKFQRAMINLSLKKDELYDINLQKRKKLIEYAYHNIEFYKEYYDASNFHPSQFNKSEDWEKIPFLEKDMIKKNFNKLIDKNAKSNRFISSTTGGSTGKPLKVFRDKGFPDEILQWRMLKTWGIPLGSDIAMVWRIPQKNNTIKYTVFNTLIWWPARRIKLDASVLDTTRMKWFVNKCNKLKPVILYGVYWVTCGNCFLLQEKQTLKMVT